VLLGHGHQILVEEVHNCVQALGAAEITDGDLQRIVNGELLLLLVRVYKLAN